METVSGFLAQAYWWLSLLGGMHCIVLAFLLWLKGLKRQNSQLRIVLAIFITLSLYFFTGVINRENAPLPIHIILAMITPIYFLLMPLVHRYCKNELNCQSDNDNDNGMPLWHYFPALIVAFTVLIFTVTHFNTQDFLKSEAVENHSINTFSLLGMVLPALLLVQTLVYVYAIIGAIKGKGNSDAELPNSTLDNLKIRWLLVLAIAIIVNWLIRCLLASFPFVFGDQYWLITQTVTRFNLLMTLYILAVYRLQQLTVIAYQNGLVAQKRDKTEKPISEILDSDEKDYLSTVFKDNQSN